MKKLLPLILSLIAFCASAQTSTSEAAVENASPWAIAAFAIAFFGLCLGYAWHTWRESRKDQTKPAIGMSDIDRA